jgi:hypothetical protein
MARSIGIREFLDREFVTYPFDGPWADTFGEPERNMRVIIYGRPGQGKTEFCIQMAKYMAKFTKVYYNSFEQGISRTLQKAIERQGLIEVSGKVVFGDQETYEEMLHRLAQRNSPQVVFIDSRDYINLTAAQFKNLIDLHPRKAFVVICWEAGGKPRGEYAKQIEFMCDVKIRVDNFIAHPRSRFGGNQRFVIWDRKPVAGQHISMFDQSTAKNA